MKIIQINNREKWLKAPLGKSDFSFFPFSQITFKKDNGEGQLSNNLKNLLQQLINKVEAADGFLAYGKGESQNVIHAGKTEPDLRLRINDQRLLMMGKPLTKKNIYIHPIMQQNCFSGFIGVSRNTKTWTHLCQELVHAYALLAGQNIEMQDKHDDLQKHAESLLKKKKELEKIQEYNQNLLSITTHDLASPLNAVSGYLDMIDHHLTDGANAQKLQDYYKRIQSGVNDVSEMLNQLNEVINFKKGFLQLHTVTVDINWVIKNTCDLLKAGAEKKDIKLQVIATEEPVYIDVDVVKFKRVVYNLVSNAIKYTNPQQHIFVSIEAGDENVKLHVKDEGVGIAKDNLNTIFKPFVKLDETEDPENGFSKGLGLYISSYFIELMGGNIAAKSGTGKGSTFTVEMPLAVAPEHKANAV